MATVRFCIFASLFFTSLTSVGQATVTMTLTDSLREVSGMATDGEYLWMINDSGNEPLLFEFRGEQWVGTYPVAAKNTDWEALTMDIAGNLYVADIGDNANRRTNRTIYMIPRSQVDHTYDTLFPTPLAVRTHVSIDSIEGTTDFDWESLIWYGGSFHIFSKNRRSEFDGASIHFKASATSGNADEVAVFHPMDTTSLGGLIREMSWVTDATLSVDRRHLFLLSSDKVYAFMDFPEDRFFEGFPLTLSLGSFTQKESITAWNDTTLLIADEVSPLGGGKVYYLNIAEELEEYTLMRREEVSIESRFMDSTLTIHIDPLVSSKVYLELFDENGRGVRTSKIGEVRAGEETDLIVDVSALKTGMYIVNIRIGRFPHGFFVAKKGDWREVLERQNEDQSNE